MSIPRGALLLGLAGVLPFLWGAVCTHVPALNAHAVNILGERFAAPQVQIAYGIVILSFMSGVLWGFAVRARERQTAGYALSVLPALWAFFMVGGDTQSAILALMAGFLGLLGLDYIFAKWGLAPAWWMRLRTLLTGLVIACLLTSLI